MPLPTVRRGNVDGDEATTSTVVAIAATAKTFPFSTLVSAMGSPAADVLAARLRVSRRTIHRWMAADRLNVWIADRFAVRAGFHPVEVWGDAWWDRLHSPKPENPPASVGDAETVVTQVATAEPEPPEPTVVVTPICDDDVADLLDALLRSNRGGDPATPGCSGRARAATPTDLLDKTVNLREYRFPTPSGRPCLLGDQQASA